MKNVRIAVAGTGYVGLSIATLLSQHHQVTAVDIVPEKVELINKKLILVSNTMGNELNVTIDKKHFLLLFCPTLILSLAECFTGLYIDIVLSFLGIAVFLFVNRKMISLLLVKIHKKCEIDRVKKHE